MNDQAQRLRELAVDQQLSSPRKETGAGSVRRAKNAPQSISVTSGKGGVGKTNCALFLATAFAAMKKRVLLLDADLGLANVHILMGIAPRKTIADVVAGTCRINEVVTTTPGGFDIIPGASGLEKMAILDRGRLELLQREFRRLETRYDLLLVDTGAGIGTAVTQFASGTDLTLVVITPEPTSLADAYAMVKVLSERTDHPIGIVVNMAVSDREGSEIFDRLNALVVKFLKRSLEHYCTLPQYREVGQYVRKQRLLLLEKSNTVFSRRIYQLAARIAGSGTPVKSGFFDRLVQGMRNK
ncbi:MAG: AAA family ATPase [Chitinispirillaceae bacterium]|nr:AAA family ATPase [Chitinispirillaceae bacterium]